MDCLEFNLHQLILSELARNVGQAVKAGDPDAQSGVEMLASRVETRDVPVVSEGTADAEQPRVFMSSAMVHANIAFGELAPHVPESDIDNTVLMLIAILADVPHIDFEPSLSWQDWALPDQVVHSTVSAMLQLAASHPSHRPAVMAALSAFSASIVTVLRAAPPAEILTQHAPAFHGLYRAVISNPFPWALREWTASHGSLNSILDVDVLERLNLLMLHAEEEFENETIDSETLELLSVFSARYADHGRPLSGYFMVCCVIEIQWTILAQVLVPPVQQVAGSGGDHQQQREAMAANNAWLSLMREPALKLQLSTGAADALRATVEAANTCFTDLLLQLEEMDEPPDETYAWETMSESLKLVSLCSVALQELDPTLYSRVKLLLSDNSPVWENLIQESALKATTVLAHNFPSIATKMVSHLRRFVTSPLPIFEVEFVGGMRAPPPLVAAARCMALCIKLAPGDDLMMSNMYTLLNHVASTGKDRSSATPSVDGHSSLGLGASPYMHPADNNSTLHSSDAGLRNRSDDQKRIIAIATISVVSQLALEFQDEEVTKLTISMLLQRMRVAEATVEAAIAYNLVDLALTAPASSVSDITRAFSAVARSANVDDPRLSSNMIIASQTRLAQDMKKRPDLYEPYLIELLNLFCERGVALQQNSGPAQLSVLANLIDRLSAQLLPIDALLSHKDFRPHEAASADLVAQFRNTWFLCVLFQLTALDQPLDTLTEWRTAVLRRIATKTPPLVLEETQDFASSAIEFNSVIRHDYAAGVIYKHRAALLKYMPIRSHEIKHLNSAQVVFLLTMHDLEVMRSTEGLPASLVSYFVNEGLNKPGELATCMDSIVEEVIRRCVVDLGKRVMEHNIATTFGSELRSLLVLSCHRISKARDVAIKYLHRLVNTFPSLLCDPSLVFAILEVLTLLRRASEGQVMDEDNPVYEFQSARADINLQLVDNYAIRDEMLNQLYRNVQGWFKLALSRAPVEFQSTLQKYLSSHDTISYADSVELGASVALRFADMIPPSEKKIAQVQGSLSWQPDRTKVFTSQLACKEHFIGEAGGVRLANRHRLEELQSEPPVSAPSLETNALKTRLAKTLQEIHDKTSTLTVPDLKRLLFRCASALIPMTTRDYDLQHYAVALPFEVFTPAAMSVGIEIWTWLIEERPDLEMALAVEIERAWMETIANRRGIFSTHLNFESPFYHEILYTPTDKVVIDYATLTARRALTPHTMVLQMLFSRFQALRYQKPVLVNVLRRIIIKSARAFRFMSTHPLAREARISFLLFGFEYLKSAKLDAVSEAALRESLYQCALGWFSVAPQWSFGSNKVQLDADVKLLVELLDVVQRDTQRDAFQVSSLDTAAAPYSGNMNLRLVRQLLALLVENEIVRLNVWSNPTNDPKRGTDHVASIEKAMNTTTQLQLVRTAWTIEPAIAVHMAARFKSQTIQQDVTRLVRAHTKDVLGVPEAVRFLVGERLDSVSRDLRYLPLFAPVTPVLAIGFFEPRFLNNPLALQYAYRVLVLHPVQLTFFFVPQIVQALRSDPSGYVERFILDTTKISQLFCHQILWNMKANCYKGDLAEVEDPMKPTLDKMIDQIVGEMTDEARAFYDRQFGFFKEVTDISGKLKPFIRKTKPEKKAKIDEEMAKIVVDVGVYLPSNPDGVVIDIDKKSGRPLQSHAKAPFMATFKVRKEKTVLNTDPDAILEGEAEETRTTFEVWQQAIFKVGDDCRQDVLALQVIAMFKNIFNSVGLVLYLFPYRVVSTAPGCGVIDVIPNSTSRDEMGRSKVNDLLGFFAAKYGGQNTIAFQKARLNFVQSMAAYSVVCYILQIKDRHNGNIMIDGDGHIVHIDFGFLFDIGPGGVKFEPNSFKLTHEMILLMGGRQSQGFNTFVQMTVKAFLALRPYADDIVNTVQLMLGTGLPSFKGEPTIKRLRDRFALDCNERQAAEWMMAIVKDANENVRTTVYDEFQRMQNGIPYA